MHGIAVFDVRGTFTYTPELGYNGTDVFTFTVLDGVLTDTAVISITVANVAPILASLPDQIIKVGEVLTITGIFTDPGLLDAHTVDITWADGLTETLVLAAGVSTFEATHTYTQTGAYTVTVSVADEDGGQDAVAFVITVTPDLYTVVLPILFKP